MHSFECRHKIKNYVKLLLRDGWLDQKVPYIQEVVTFYIVTWY